MYDYNKPFGESCYRLRSKTGQFIYLKTRGYLEIDKDTNKVHSFVCINTLVSEDEGKRMVSEMKRKFSIIIDPDATIPESDSEDMAVENPMQIEQAIMNLITNLEPSGNNNEAIPALTAPPSYASSEGGGGSNSGSRRAMSGGRTNTSGSDGRSAGSPPLVIIAPMTSTIKSSVTKTMEVISGKRPPVPLDSDDEEVEEEEEKAGRVRPALGGVIQTNLQHDGNTSRPSVVHRTTSNEQPENCFTNSRAGSNNSGSSGTNTVFNIKPELQDQVEGFNYYSEMENISTVQNHQQQQQPQFLRIKQEILSGESQYSPASASSTVSSLSNEQQGSSNSSTSIAAAASGFGLNQTGVLVVGVKRRKTCSASVDDISEAGLPSPGTDSTNAGQLPNICAKD